MRVTYDSVRELVRYELGLVGVQEVRWDTGGTVRAGDYTSLYGKGNENHQLGTGFFIHQRTVPAVTKVDDVIYSAGEVAGVTSFCMCMHRLRRKMMTQRTVFLKNQSTCFDHFPEYHTKIQLADFNAKLGREDIFKPTTGNDSLHEDSNDNGVRVVNFATSKNLVVKSKMFPHRNIHKYTWTYNQIDHVLIHRRWHSGILDV